MSIRRIQTLAKLIARHIRILDSAMPRKNLNKVLIGGLLVFSLGLTVGLSACQQPEPTPTPTQVPPIPTEVVMLPPVDTPTPIP